ncbi:hypothetical protein P4O66_020039 [Electrophorus voltai]|uniref:Tyrosine-protein kinase n=1 Tax=Electrophorus voltai TaxID=2609070 RepID=A0AAD9E4V0_9TELE|nr:hypothetical protein P4O66_020039 [Electrophorus voltai]
MYPRVILRGTLYKKSQQKRRTSPCNYKERYFVLNTEELTYSERRPGKKPIQKGCIELSRIRCVEIVRSDLPIPCEFKYPFQRRFSRSEEKIMVALKNFSPQEDTDIPLHKDEEYVVIDGSEPNWWKVKDKDGNIGTVPLLYLTEKLSKHIEDYEWYNKDIARPEAEELLMKEDKEGAFMVRNSRQAGVYTVSVFTKAPGSNGEKFPRVKHYRIRETAESLYYLAEKYLFPSIPELIHYHQHNAAEKWELDPEEVTRGEELGSGNFGLVWKGHWRGENVAVKTIREDAMTEEEFKEEAEVMMKLSHPKLVQLYGLCTQRSPICLVFEFLENGCLSDFLRSQRGCLSKDTLLQMCLDVSEAMAYLESSNFIHRDLAARNCLVSKDLIVKVSDFGMTRYVLDDQYRSYTTKFPVKWSSPEVIKFSKFSSKSDVWSYGVLMWEVYSEGKLPYECRSNMEVVESLNAGQRLLQPRLCPETVYQLMQWCWKEKPDDRPSFVLLLHELASLADPMNPGPFPL